MISADQEKPSLDELTHFGIKGMHWGIRKNRKPQRELTSEEKSDRRKRNAKIAVGAIVAARVLFVVGTMAAGTVLQNRSLMETGVKAIGRSNMLKATVTRGVFKVTSL